jgi:lipopolysaccharide/colanic/teichoic acid biosynthesis glycosyltransferase
MHDQHITADDAGFERAFAQSFREGVNLTSGNHTSSFEDTIILARPAESPSRYEREILWIYREIHAVYQAHRICPRYELAKRALDVTAASCLLLLFGPLLLLLALAVRLDSPGPAFFIQQRVGRHGRLFRMYKLRTMFHDCPELNGSSHKLENDSRITRTGRYLRKTSLDELPQLINVLRGDMSLVGPRPELPSIMLRRYEAWQYQRLLVPQGITGWWQVTGRSQKPLHLHTGDDLHYIEQASFWFDLKILFLTVRAVVKRDGAY